VALKLVRVGARNTIDKDRVAREAVALAKLSHPNVVAVFEIGEHEGHVFIVMEHVEGITLGEWQIREWQINPEGAFDRILEVYLQAAAALHAAHEAGVVHGDFKPSNALVGKDGRVRVLDFGLARSIADFAKSPDVEPAAGAAELSRSRFGGTPAYMAPEQGLCGMIDARTDQFNYCVALWEAIHTVRPWQPSEVALIAANPSNVPSPATRYRWPRWMRRVLLRGLEPLPARRWASMADLVREIRLARRRRKQALWTVAAIGILIFVTVMMLL
jgi:eukaryotic-like serine/threonine-protein kinase